ncbi:MAG: tRNA (adenosine(37)-N6)-dimethylallyltransferase MiaA [Bacteroidales bacterium]|nr:tRNA (adenosine(37)-N6)-dimethylallyltransferase MiaA [Bacteroidales bacterium]
MSHFLSTHPLIAIIGPTASGKTKVAVDLALEINSEIISGDSRQVYRGMGLGTGKDIGEYRAGEKTVPYHLIDIVDAGYKYNIHEFQNDFFKAYHQIIDKNKIPILCGGSGLYVESVTQDFNLTAVPPNRILQKELEGKTLDELAQMLSNLKALHNRSDIETKRRAIRAIEIANYQKEHPEITSQFPQLNTLFIGIDIEREDRRKKITRRLTQRLEEGMLDEVRELLKTVSAEDLIYYGLEYKYLTLHLLGKLTYNEMFEQLEIAIHQFAKRQMTWYRGMERRGININWISSKLSPEEKNRAIIMLMKEQL